MAQTAETLDRFDLGTNVREDLSDVIYNISPTEVPAQSNFGRGTAEQTFKEWQIDELRAAANNAAIDGDEFAGDPLNDADRIGNYLQISREDIVVSRRANIVNKAGRKSEVAYQIAKAGKALRRDVEFAICARKIAVAGNSTTASESAGIPAWIRTNLVRPTGGTAPTLSGTTEGFPNGIGTDPGDTNKDRALDESEILQVIRECYDEGGNPNVIMLNTRSKQGLSNFLFSSTSTRIATQYQDQGANPRSGISVVGAVDVYVTDFGVLDIVPNRFMPQYSVTAPGTDAGQGDGVDIGAECFILDTEYWEVAYLDGYKVETIAKIGDHERRMLLVDWTLCSLNQAASGLVADFNDATDVIA